MPSRFLVTGARSPTALDWIRRLGRAGHGVAAADSLRHPLCRGTRYLDRYFEVPSARTTPRDYAFAVRDAAHQCGAEWVIPTCEEIFYLAHYREIFAGTCQLLADPFDVLARLHHKGEFAALTASGGPVGTCIHSPESHEFRSPGDLEDFATAQGGSLTDWVLKPVYSRFASDIHIRPQPAAWQKVEPTSAAPWLAQRFAAGAPFCTYSLAIAGTITAHTTYIPKHQVDGGAGFYFEPVERPDLFQFCSDVVKHFRFTGQICFDFISGENGTVVIECNPRATSGLHLLDERDPLPFLHPSAGDAALWPMAPQPRMLGAAMWMKPGRLARWRDYRRAADVYQAPDDRLPLLAAPRSMRELYHLARRLGLGTDLLAASTADLLWNGEPIPD